MIHIAIEISVGFFFFFTTCSPSFQISKAKTMIIFILYYSANCADWFSFILQEPKINFPLQLLYVLNITIQDFSQELFSGDRTCYSPPILLCMITASPPQTCCRTLELGNPIKGRSVYLCKCRYSYLCKFRHL